MYAIQINSIKKKNEAVGKGHMYYYVTNFPFRKQARILPGCLCIYMCVFIFLYIPMCMYICRLFKTYMCTQVILKIV